MTLCTAPRERKLINLNLRLREAGIDARYSSAKDEAFIRVPPTKRASAQEIAEGYGHDHPTLELRFPL